jgi:tetratricopeptide (TPR) repeat protein
VIYPLEKGGDPMGIFDRLRAAFSNGGSSTSVDDAPTTVTAYDAFGRQVEIPRKEWETKVLPDSLAQAGDDPDKLYGTMVMALEDGFVEPLVEPTARLLEIDPDRLRSHTLRGIVLLKTGDLEGAEKILTAHVNQFGPSGTILTNLAKVYLAQGRKADSEGTLWRAIELDPNQDNGLLWWCALERDKSGSEAGFWEAMRKAAAIPGSWRPQLWLAREAVEHNDLAQARAYYEHVLARAADEPEVLMMISGDLGNHGHVAQMIELVLPIYDPARHDPWTGLNLLQACLETNELAEGERLVHRMFEVNRPDLRDRLYHYSAEFDKLRAALPRAIASNEPIDVEVVGFERPIWYYGLDNPTWLLSAEVDRGDQIVLLPLANITQNNLSAPTSQREDELGRLSRSLPLYLLESLYFWTPLAPKLVLPVVRGRGPVVTGSAWSADQVLSFADGAKFAVSGTLDQVGDRLKIELSVWNVIVGEVTDRFEYATSLDRVGEAILRLEKDVAGAVVATETTSGPCERYYCRPDAAQLSSYATGLAQTLMLSLAANGVISTDALWGQRNMLEYCLNVALRSPDSQPAKILFLGALVKSHAIGLDVFSEFQRQALGLVDQEQDHASPFYRLSPLVLRIFDPELFHLSKKELLEGAAGEYRAWLEGLAL